MRDSVMSEFVYVCTLFWFCHHHRKHSHITCYLLDDADDDKDTSSFPDNDIHDRFQAASDSGRLSIAPVAFRFTGAYIL